MAKRLAAVANVSEMLASLGEHVQTHFDEEETAGFFDDVTDDISLPKFKPTTG